MKARWQSNDIVVNTLAESYSYITVSACPGGAAEHTAARRSSKYASFLSSHVFQPLALETLGPINSFPIVFLAELGRRLGRCFRTVT